MDTDEINTRNMKLRMQDEEKAFAAHKESALNTWAQQEQRRGAMLGESPVNQCAARISCAELLHMRADQFRRKAEALDRLAAALPAGLARLDRVADELLFEMISTLRVF